MTTPTGAKGHQDTKPTGGEVRDIVGVWRLVSGATTDETGKTVAIPYGPRGMGLVTFTSDGRMMAVLVDGRTTLPDGTKREYASYCGSYTFDGSTLTTKVDANSDPGRFTVDQVRRVRYEGDRMVFMPPPSVVNGVRIQRNLTWERISGESL